MKNTVIYLVLTCVIALLTFLASCAPAGPTTEKPTAPEAEKPSAPTTQKPTAPPSGKEDMVKLTLTKSDGTVVEKQVEKPRYGGMFTTALSTPPLYLDDVFGHMMRAQTYLVTNEGLLVGNWARGPAGTGETGWLYTMIPYPLDLQVGCLAESWERTDPQTLVFHIRKGVNWQNKPPTNGREMTADDVVFSIKRNFTTPTALQYSYRTFFDSVTAPDKWTVIVKAAPGEAGRMFEQTGLMMRIAPRDTVEKYGDLRVWQNSCGTGPFTMTDYLEGSSVTFQKNPNYWMKDPLHPGNTLPYLDSVKMLIIPDPSTRIAALRTGKIDQLNPLTWDDARSLMNTNPELKWKEYPSGSTSSICWRTDKPQLPYQNIKIRRALAMAIDNAAIAKDFFGGHAEVVNWPVGPIPEFKTMYIPFDKLPDSTRELYEYHPDKAKQLLAEAGYPNGFKTEIVCQASDVDLLSLVKAYWSKIGVDLKLDVKEYGVYSSIMVSREFEHMFVNALNSAVPFQFFYSRPGSPYNFSRVDDPRINDAYKKMQIAYFDTPTRVQTMKELITYEVEQGYVLPLPAANLFTSWQPWVKAYDGELQVGYMMIHNFYGYLWIDQDLREKTLGRR